jgi:hypothetical protein
VVSGYWCHAAFPAPDAIVRLGPKLEIVAE